MKSVFKFITIALFIFAIVICFKSYESHYAIYFKLFEFAILFFAIFALSGQIWRAINVAYNFSLLCGKNLLAFL